MRNAKQGNDLKEIIDLFRQRCERISLPAFDRVQPSDSISQIGSKVREGRVHPSQTSSVTGRSRVSSCSRSSKASSVLSERVKVYMTDVFICSIKSP